MRMNARMEQIRYESGEREREEVKGYEYILFICYLLVKLIILGSVISGAQMAPSVRYFGIFYTKNVFFLIIFLLFQAVMDM